MAMASVGRIIVRKISTSAARFSSAPDPKTAESSMKLWKKLTIFVGLPCIALSGLNVYLAEPEKRPEFIAYEYLRVRRKPFPWGDGTRSLLHNPHMNALPDGYEDER